jgi:hypothetical protein
MKRDRRFLLSEIEDIIQTMPPRATIRHRDREENVNWFGRASARHREMESFKERPSATTY